MITPLLKPITSTIYGADLQTAQLLGIPYKIKQNTTLNEKFGIQAGVAHSSTQYPQLKYICAGIKGHRSKAGVNGIEIGEVNQHTPIHAALFEHIPWIARETNNDLSPQERERFALRKIESHNGKNLIVYYLRRLDTAAVNTQLKYSTVTSNSNDNTTAIKTTDFTPTAAELNPVPQPLKPVDVNTLDGDYVRCEAIIPFEMSKWDLDEFKNAANLIYGDERYAIITEIGLCTGVDKVVAVSGAGSSNFNYKEAIAVQVAAFVATDFRAYFHNARVGLDINIGATEPMFKMTAP